MHWKLVTVLITIGVLFSIESSRADKATQKVPQRNDIKGTNACQEVEKMNAKIKETQQKLRESKKSNRRDMREIKTPKSMGEWNGFVQNMMANNGKITNKEMSLKREKRDYENLCREELDLQRRRRQLKNIAKISPSSRGFVL